MRRSPKSLKFHPERRAGSRISGCCLHLEELESRLLLSIFSPAQIRHAYGIDRVVFSTGTGQVVPGDGRGQTIAVVDAFDAPGLVTSTSTAFGISDLAQFDRAVGLPNPPWFKKVDVNGGAHYPAKNSSWAMESALDVEWAHAIAPKAGILLVEAASDSGPDLLKAVNFARRQPGVVAVSMSWYAPEFANEAAFDSNFTTPAGHAGVTFVAATGDEGPGQGPAWPAVSPNVLAVGGTTLHTADARGTYVWESAWIGSEGGISQFESAPPCQSTVQGTGRRGNPDVAYNADPDTGYYVYETDPATRKAAWYQVGGTSAGAPQWAALVAIADQGLALRGKGPLDGAAQTLPALYGLSAGDFHDITTGPLGIPVGAGYDLATGRGTPVANRLIPDLIQAIKVGTRTLAKPANRLAELPLVHARTNFIFRRIPSGPIEKKSLVDAVFSGLASPLDREQPSTR
jgi:subtilase family serine protease